MPVRCRNVTFNSYLHGACGDTAPDQEAHASFNVHCETDLNEQAFRFAPGGTYCLKIAANVPTATRVPCAVRGDRAQGSKRRLTKEQYTVLWCVRTTVLLLVAYYSNRCMQLVTSHPVWTMKDLRETASQR